MADQDCFAGGGTQRVTAAPSRAALYALAAFSGLLGACGPSGDRDIVLLEGTSTSRVPIRSAYAEYIELPDERNDLRFTFADYAVSCERWIPPREGGHAITVAIVTPPKSPPKVGSYGWTGLPKEGPVTTAYALPKLLVADRSRLFEPGGAVQLTAVHLEPHGTITGTLGFEFPGDAEHPATRISGSFEAKMCRFSKPER